MEDINGDVLNFGDRVRYYWDDNNSLFYEFNITSMDSDGWIWGDDIPEDHKYVFGDDSENFHNPKFCERVYINPWGRSVLEFRFR